MRDLYFILTGFFAGAAGGLIAGALLVLWRVKDDPTPPPRWDTNPAPAADDPPSTTNGLYQCRYCWSWFAGNTAHVCSGTWTGSGDTTPGVRFK